MKQTNRTLAAILVVAAGVRLVGIRFGLPNPMCRPDETSITSIAGSFSQGHLNPHFFNYPPLFMVAVAVAFLAWLRGGLLLGYVRNVKAMHALETGPSLHWIARVLSAASGVATVAVLYRIAVRLFDRTTALVAAAFLALAFLHVRDSHFGVTDVAATFMAMVAFAGILRLEASSSIPNLLAAAVAAGLATATKYNVALIGLPAFVVMLAPREPQPMGRRIRRTALFTAVMIAAFLIAAPFSVIEWQQFLDAVRSESEHLASGHGVIVGRGWYVHVFVTLRYGLGWPMLAAGLVGLATLVYRRQRVGALVALFPVSYYLLLGSGYTVFVRYMMPVVPFLCLTAAYAAVEAARSVAVRVDRPRWAPGMVAAAAALVLLPSVLSVISFDRLIALTDNRLIAAEWIEQQFPNGATLAQLGRESGHVFVAADTPNAGRFVNVDFNGTGPRPDVIVVPSSRLQPETTLGTLAGVLAAEYRLGAEFKAVAYDANSVYDRQDEFYLPLAGFDGITRPGPDLKLYVRSSPAQ